MKILRALAGAVMLLLDPVSAAHFPGQIPTQCDLFDLRLPCGFSWSAVLLSHCSLQALYRVSRRIGAIFDSTSTVGRADGAEPGHDDISDFD